jgi:polysaccharide biosynthesis transport protein
LEVSNAEQDNGLDAGSVDLREYVRCVWRRKWLALGVTVLVVAVAAIITARQPRIYASSTSVIIDATAPRVLDNQQVQEVVSEERANYWLNKEYSQTQLRIIQSRAVARRVVEKLGLQTDAAFLGLDKVQDEAERASLMAQRDAIEVLRQRTSVSLERDSRLVNIQVQDTNPQRAALLANELAESYLAESIALKLKATETASTWLEERLKELEVKSKASELAVYDFKKDANLLTTALENRLSIVSERLNAYNVALTEVRTKMAALKARVEAIQQLQQSARSDSFWAEGLPLSDSRLLDDMRQRLFTARADCAEMLDRYLENHPKLSACQEKVKTLEAQLQRELANRVTAAQTELVETAKNEKNLMQLLDAAKQEAFEINRKQLDFDRLQRDAANDQRLYDLVLKRLKDIELSGLLRTSNVRILDPARPSTAPIRPSVMTNLAVALFGGLVLGIALALLLERLDNRIKGQADVEEGLQLPVLGVFPSLALERGDGPQERDFYVYRNPTSSAAECCRAIRTNLLFSTPDKPFKTLVVTSSGPQEGKSTLAISMGVAMAQNGNRVLIIDTDMRRPRLHRAFGVPNDVGVSSLVVQECVSDDAIKSTSIPNVFVLPCGPVPPNPAELLHTHSFRALLEELKGRFDRIILDSPPVNAVTDAVVLGAMADGVVLVLKAQETQRELARRCVQALRGVKAKLLGAVLNDVDLSQGSYGGYYPYMGNGEAYSQPATAQRA